MSYTKNKEEINKVLQINSSNNRGRYFLRTGDFNSARECFNNTLEMEADNYEALTSLLVMDHNFKSVDELIAYYQSAYLIKDVEKIKAFEPDFEFIEQIANKYTVDDYLNKQEIRDLFEYSGETSYGSLLNSYIRQKQLLDEEVVKNPYLLALSKSDDKQAQDFLKKIYEPYEKLLEEAKKNDEYNRNKLISDYQNFLGQQEQIAKDLYEESKKRKDDDYQQIVELYNEAFEIPDYEKCIEEFNRFSGYKEADEYINRAHEEIEKIKERQLEEERQNKIYSLLDEASNTLHEENYEKADELYRELLKLDEDNSDAYMGILLARYHIKDKEKLVDIFFEKDYEALPVKVINESKETLDKYIERYYIPYYLEKEAIKKSFTFPEATYDSYVESARKKKEELRDRFKNEEILSWLYKNNDAYILSLYQQLNDKYDEEIKKLKEKDELEAVNKTVKYQRFLKANNRDIKQRYDEAIKNRERDYLEVKDNLKKTDSITEIREIKRILNNLGEYKDSKDLLYEALNRIEELKEKEKQDNFRKELETYINDAKKALSEDRYDDADLLFQKVLSFDNENADARIGLLQVENKCHNQEELLEKYDSLYSPKQFTEKDYKKISCEYSLDDHIKDMAERYYIPDKLEKNTIINLYNNEDISYYSIVDRLKKLREDINDEISLDENIAWLYKNENNLINTYFRDLFNTLEEQIKLKEEEDKENQNKLEEEYKEYVKEIDLAVVELYKAINGVELTGYEAETIDDNLEDEEETKEKAPLKYNLNGLFDRKSAYEKTDAIAEINKAIEPEIPDIEVEPDDSFIEAFNYNVDQIQNQDEQLKQEAETIKDLPVLEPVKQEISKPAETHEEEIKTSGNKTIFIMVALILLMSALVINIAYRTIIKPDNMYRQAVELIGKNQFDEAIEIFEQLGDYRDSENRVKDTIYQKAQYLYKNKHLIEALNLLNDIEYSDSETKIEEIKQEIIKNAKVGDTVVYGQYEQDGDSSNGREFIEWQVLAQEENRLLVISKYCLDVQKYNNESIETDWKSSSIRSWLNGRFAANAFDKEDPGKVVITNLYSVSETDEEEDQITNDRVFLLGIEEIEEYFSSEKERICMATENLKESNLYIDSNGNCKWWLRDGITEDENSAFIIETDGTITESMYEISNGVRPVMWMNR